MRSKIFISVLVALALVFSFAVSVKDAKADAILFPWVIKSDAVSTIISVVNTAGIVGSYEFQSIPFRLHYDYYYKRTTDNLQTEDCINHSFKQFTSKDDIITFDASGNINAGLPLFFDTSPYDLLQPMNLIDPGPRRAFLIVDNNTGNFNDLGVNEDGTLYGEAIVLEIAGGAAWGYIAFNAAEGTGPSQTAPVTFRNGQDDQGEVVGGAISSVAGVAVPNPHGTITLGIRPEITQTVLLPDNMGTTRFFFTPADMTVPAGAELPTCPVDSAVPNQRLGNINTRIQLIAQQPDGTYIGGMYNNDEEILDFHNPKNIVCTSGDNVDQLVAGGALNYLQTTGKQGWAYMDPLEGTYDSPTDPDICPDNPSVDMIIGKLEFTTTGIDFDNDTVLDMTGTFNNFVWLRDRTEIVPGPAVGTNIIHNCRWQPFPAPGARICVNP
jgi:hypothetical protein